MNYHSFLICFHESHIDVYENGLPIGVIRDGKFQIHEHVMPDGTKVPVEISDGLALKVAKVASHLLP